MKTFTKISSLLTLAIAVCWGFTMKAQNTCDTAIPITCGETTFGSTVGVPNDNATSGAIACPNATNFVLTVGTSGQIWYSFTAPSDGLFTLSLDNPNTIWDTKVHVYSGTCGALACVASDDDSGIGPTSGLSSVLSWTGTANTTYLIRMGGFNIAEGSYQLDFLCDLFTDGCTNPTACNYSTSAINDDGSCCFGLCETLVIAGGFATGEISWILQDISGNQVASGVAGTTAVCVPASGCGYQFIMSDSGGNGWNNNTYTFTNSNGDIDATGTLGAGLSTGTDIISFGTIDGCTDQLASNYDPAAQCDDGSCLTCLGGGQPFGVLLHDSFGDGWNGATFTVLDEVGTIMLTGTFTGGFESTFNDCLIPGCYTFNVTNGTFPAEVSWDVVDQGGNILFSGVAGDVVGFSWAGQTGCVIPGCTDVNCNNYNQFATTDDGTCECPPPNDDCANAIDIACGETLTGTTLFSNADGVLDACSGIAVTGKGIWYSFLGTGDQVNLSTCGSVSTVDTKIHVFQGDCSTPICVAGNDEGCDAFPVVTSSISFSTLNGITYYALVSQANNFIAGIDFSLAMTCADCAGIPINDECENALPIPAGINFPGNLCCSNADSAMVDFTFGDGTTQYGIWYFINSDTADALSLEFWNGSGEGADANDGANVGIGVFQGAAGCDGLVPVIGGVGFDGTPTDGFIFNSYENNITILPNTNYYFCLSTSDVINCGDFVINITLSDVGCTDPAACNYCANCDIADASCEYVSCGAIPVNDLCADAIPLICNTSIAGTTGGSTNTGAPAVCPAGAGDAGVWYSFTGDGQFVNISSCGSAIDSRIMVVSSATGCGGPYTCVISEDNDNTTAGCGVFDANDASVGFTSVIGTNYFVYITSGAVDTDGDGINDLTDGGFTLDFSCAPVLAGCLDVCACNYNAQANVDSGNCDYVSCAGCSATESGIQILLTDNFGDGWNGGTYSITDLAGTVVASGNIDNSQCTAVGGFGGGIVSGFDVLCLEDGCYEITAGGGTFPFEIGWTLVAEDGSIIATGNNVTLPFVIGGGSCGCTLPTACNYDPAATIDDGSCESLSCAGCTDATACNFDPTATIAANTLCCYNLCATLTMNDTFGDGWNGNVATITDASNGTIIGTATITTGFTGTASFCLTEGCYTISVGGGTFPNEVSWNLSGTNNGVFTGGVTAGLNFSIGANGNCIIGCTQPLACNYNPDAGLSDCSLCEYDSCSGCTYADATNYDATAVIDDGSCLFDGVVSSCPWDFNGNQIVDVQDLLQFIVHYGDICP